MASTLGEAVGETVGYRVRFASKVSRKTRIEVVTEGVFTRMVLEDASLGGVAALLFDEFHERSLDADLGLALARDVQTGLRDDLRLLVMSATIDGRGWRSFATRRSSRATAAPLRSRQHGAIHAPIERAVADTVIEALRLSGLGAGVPARRRRDRRLKRFCASASAIGLRTLSRLGALEAVTAGRAIAPAPQAGARSCRRPRLRRPRSPSKACASW
jgi:ATP-dependent helicase HrpB